MIPTFVSYATEKRLSKEPERFGQGAIEGVAGPEAANNAAAAGVLVPLLTLGLPSSATAAVLLTAFQQYGLQPGPLLFTSRPDLVWTLIASLYVGNVMLLVLNLPLVGIWARVMLMPRRLLFAGILVLASLGAYSLNGSLVDLAILYLVGAVGCAMRIYDVPLVPAVLGLVLGPLSELQFRRAMAISEGDISIFVTRPISAVLLFMAAMLLIGSKLVTETGDTSRRASWSDATLMNRKPDYDVAVVGGGNAALCAAITARRAGARVIVLERAPRDFRGGNSRHTRNFRCLHTTPGSVFERHLHGRRVPLGPAERQRGSHRRNARTTRDSSIPPPVRNGWPGKAFAFRQRCTARCSLAGPICSSSEEARR